MGLLTTPEKTGIDNGYPIRQVWKIWCPESVSHSAYGSQTIEDTGDSTVNPRVLDAGERDFSCYNLSIGNPGDFEIPEYTIEVSNAEGEFYPAIAGSFFIHPTTAYEALPQECYLTHEVYVGSTSNKLPCSYIGSIVSISYEDTSGMDSLKPAMCVIATEPTVISRVLNTEWTEDVHSNESAVGLSSWVLEGTDW
jgi:hypothetical protein